MNSFKFECECGQTTHFVIGGDGIAHRDTTKHGEGYDRESCLNCGNEAINKPGPPPETEPEKAVVVQPVCDLPTTDKPQKQKPKHKTDRSK